MVPYSHNEELFHRFEMKRNMSPYRRETDRRHCLSFDTLYGRFLADNKDETFLPPMSKKAFGALLNHFGERHLRDVVAKHPNIHPQAEYREGGRDRRAEKEKQAS